MPSSKTSTYLIVEARRTSYGPVNPDTGLRPVGSVHVVGQRANRPAKLSVDQIAVKVTIEVPESTFNPVLPIASIVVPEDMALRGPIQADVEDANEG